MFVLFVAPKQRFAIQVAFLPMVAYVPPSHCAKSMPTPTCAPDLKERGSVAAHVPFKLFVTIMLVASKKPGTSSDQSTQEVSWARASSDQSQGQSTRDVSFWAQGKGGSEGRSENPELGNPGPSDQDLFVSWDAPKSLHRRRAPFKGRPTSARFNRQLGKARYC